MKGEINNVIENLQNEKEILFPASDEMFDMFFCWTEIVYKYEDKGYRLNFGKTPKGIKRIMIVPAAEQLHEIEQLEKELVFDK